MHNEKQKIIAYILKNVLGDISSEPNEVGMPDRSVQNNHEVLSPWITRAEAAEYARVSTDTIDNWCAAGYLEKSKIGNGRPGRVRIDRNSLEKFLRSKVTNRKKRVRQMAPSVKGGFRVRASEE